MQIGIVPSLDPERGGVHQYAVTMLEALAFLSGHEPEDEYILFVPPEEEKFVLSLNELRWPQVPLRPYPLFRKRVLSLLKIWAVQAGLWQGLRRVRHHVGHQKGLSGPDPDRIDKRPEFSKMFKYHKVDWVIHTAPDALSFEAGVPYIMPVHDLQHRLQPEFPEVSADGLWADREYLFRNGTRFATLILADSEAGKEDILEFYGPYGVTPDRIKILPFLPSNCLSEDVSDTKLAQVRQAYRLPERYLFYPAQFWPHKNHARIVQALGLVKEEPVDKIHLVFCGSHDDEIQERTFQEVMTLAHRIGVDAQVHYLGYVPDEDMSGLYTQALGLVMPTFFGPTNIPILEAWAFGCPVLTSDIRGIREQTGDAGILVDPYSVESIAGGIYRLWTDGELRQTLADLGRQRLATYTADDYRHRLIKILEEAKARVRADKLRV